MVKITSILKRCKECNSRLDLLEWEDGGVAERCPNCAGMPIRRTGTPPRLTDLGLPLTGKLRLHPAADEAHFIQDRAFLLTSCPTWCVFYSALHDTPPDPCCCKLDWKSFCGMPVAKLSFDTEIDLTGYDRTITLPHMGGSLIYTPRLVSDSRSEVAAYGTADYWVADIGE